MTSRDLASLAAILPAAARTQNEVIEALKEQVSKLKETVAVSFCCTVVTDKYTLLKCARCHWCSNNKRLWSIIKLDSASISQPTT